MPCKQRRISASSTAHAASRDRSTSLHRLNSSRPGGFIKGEDASEDVKPLIGSNRRFLKPGTGPYCRSEKIQISPRVLGILKPFNFCILSVFAAVPFQRRILLPLPASTTTGDDNASGNDRSGRREKFLGHGAHDTPRVDCGIELQQVADQVSCRLRTVAPSTVKCHFVISPWSP